MNGEKLKSQHTVWEKVQRLEEQKKQAKSDERQQKRVKERCQWPVRGWIST